MPPLLIYPLAEAVEKGLVLDVLHYHTTRFGTTQAQQREHLLQRYEHIRDLDLLLDQLIAAQLLVEQITYPEINHWQVVKSTGRLRLAHDILAPVIQNIYDKSKEAGQLARQIIEQKTAYSEPGSGDLLTKRELQLLERGLAGMRQLTVDEMALVRSSKQALSRRTMQYRTWGAVIVIAFAVLAFLFYRSIQEAGSNQLIAETKTLLNQKKYEEALSLASRAHKILQNDLSLRNLQEAFINFSVNEPDRFKESRYYKVLQGPRFHFDTTQQYLYLHSTAGYYGDSVAWAETAAYKWLESNELVELNRLQGRYRAKGPETSDGHIVLSSIEEQDRSFLSLFSESQAPQLIETLPGGFVEFSPDLQYLLVNRFDGKAAYLYALDTITRSLRRVKSVQADSKFSDQGKYLVSSGDTTIYITSLQGGEITDSIGPFRGNLAYFDPGEKLMKTAIIDHTGILHGKFLYQLPTIPRQLPLLLDSLLEGNFFFDPGGQRVFVCTTEPEQCTVKNWVNGSLRPVDTIPGTRPVFTSENKTVITQSLTKGISFLFDMLPGGNLDSRSSIPGIWPRYYDSCRCIITENTQRTAYYVHQRPDSASVITTDSLSGNDYTLYEKENYLFVTEKATENTVLYRISATAPPQTIRTLAGYKAVVSPDGNFVFSISGDGNSIYLYDLRQDSGIRINLQTNARANTQFIRANGMLMCNAFTESAILWYQNPLLLSTEELSELIELLELD
jgi:WD40 repeat protein